MLTPSSIYAPGSPIPADDAEANASGIPRDPHAAGREAGYGVPPGAGYGAPPAASPDPAGHPYAAGSPYAAGPAYPGQQGGAGQQAGPAGSGYVPGPGHQGPADRRAGPAYTTGPPPYADETDYEYARPRGYGGGGGYAEPVNGGAYAYVIREEEEFPLRPPRQAPPERGGGTDRPPRHNQRPAHDQHPRPEPRRPEPPRPEPPRPEPPRPEPPRPEPPRPEPPRQEPSAGPPFSGQPESAEAAVPYGPDDPAYGPPSADWYAREEADRYAREEQEEEEAAGEPEEPQHVRGPFEPPQHSAEQAALYRVLAGEPPEDGGLDRPLGRLKDLYQTAEAVGADNLDKHFEELLDRQRQLIREYFSDFGRRGRPASRAGETGQPSAGQPSAGEPRAGGNGPRSGQVAFGADRPGPW